MTMIFSLVTLAALAAGPEVKVKPLTGDSLSGRLTELAADQVSLETDSGPRIVPAAKVMWAEFPAAVAGEKPTTWIELFDGSKLQALGYTSSGGKASIVLTYGSVVEVPTRSVRSVRFRQQQTPELAAQWREITTSPATGDLIVTRKTSTRTIERGENEPATIAVQALDQHEGTLLDVGPETVRFEFGGEQIDVRREKLEGLVYYQPAKRELPPPICRLIDARGSSWPLRELALAGDRLTATTIGNVALELPLLAVAKVDFSVGNVAFLSDLEPDSGGGELAVSLQPAGMTYKFGRVFQVRSGPPLGADALRIAGQRFDGGLSLHSPVTLVYRVPAGFRWFRAVAGVDDSVIAPGRFELVIRGDGKELLRHSFSGEQPRRVVPFDLDVSGVRRIFIVLDPTDGQDIGDQLDLCEARFTK